MLQISFHGEEGGGRDKVHYGPCEIGELPARINIIIVNMTKRYPKSVIYMTDVILDLNSQPHVSCREN